MRGWLFVFAVLALWALHAPAASAQARLDCAAAPASVCADGEVLALETERLALTEQLAAADPGHAVIAGEQTWIDGLGACGEDVLCYRSAYANHNETLRQSVAALPDAEVEPPLEAPPATAEEPPPSEASPAPRQRRDETRERAGPIFVPAGLPGWGFFTALGVTLLIFYALLRKLAEHRRGLREEEERLR